MSQRINDGGYFRDVLTITNEPNFALHARRGEGIIATCTPFKPGYGFFAVLVECQGAYMLYSYDSQQDFNLDAHHFDPLIPTLRADCMCSDYHPGISVKDDARVAEELCAFWQHYASEGSTDKRKTRSNDHRFTAEDNADWWARWGDYLTGQDDDGVPDGWAHPDDNDDEDEE